MSNEIRDLFVRIEKEVVRRLASELFPKWSTLTQMKRDWRLTASTTTTTTTTSFVVV